MRATRAGIAAGWLAATWLVGISSVAAGAAPSLRYAKDIKPPLMEKEELVAAPLDSDVFAATRDDLPDLRILDSAGGETAFILRPATETRSAKLRRTWTAANPKIKLLANDGLEITVVLAAQDPAPLGMRLETPLANFEQRVRVFSSDDGDDWTPVLEEGVIFDYSQFMDVRNDTLEFPAAAGGDARQFRIVIDDVTKEQQSQLMELTRRLRREEETDRSERVEIVRQPFRIDRIEFWSEVEEKLVAGKRQVDYPLKWTPAVEDADNKQTIVAVTTRREPLTKLTLETADRNFSRAARVEVEGRVNNSPAWIPVGRATVSRLDFRDLKREDLSIVIPQTREASLRVVIENRDSPPLDITGVTARGTAYEVVFLARPGEKYRLAYGSPSAAAPSYDTEAVEAFLAADYQPVAAQLGDPTELSRVEAPAAEPMLARLLNSPVILTSVVAPLVVVLGIGLYRASRRVEELPR